MNRSIEQALLSLLPTFNSALPPQLTELASSLLAQSRLRASTLKAVEEIARPYACAHIACDRQETALSSRVRRQLTGRLPRLKTSLNLPPIDPRPPIPPRVYNRLYSHLDKILPSSTPRARKVGAPDSKARDVGRSPAVRPLPSRTTPSKDKSLAQFRTPTGGKSAPTRASGPATPSRAKRGSSILPPWVQLTTGFLCKELGHELLGPTVIAGMEAIAAPHSRRTTDEWVNKNMVHLLASIYYQVELSFKDQSEEDQAGQRLVRERAILKTLRKVQGSVGVAGHDDPKAWEGWATPNQEQFRKALKEISDRNWLDSDWYLGIQDLKDTSGVQADGVDADDIHDAPSVQIRRADTMFQDKYDLLSERNREEYKIWKAKIMARIKEIERNGGGDAMEIDP